MKNGSPYGSETSKIPTETGKSGLSGRVSRTSEKSRNETENGYGKNKHLSESSLYGMNLWKE